jgi:hypothetical protein
MQRSLRWAFALMALFLLMAFATCASAQAGKEPAPVNLAAVLDGKAALWQAGPAFAAKADHAIAEMDGRPTLVIGPNGLDLNTASPIQRDSEIRAVLRFTSPKDVGTNTYIFAGLKKLSDPVENNLLTALYIPAGPLYSQSLYWSARPMPGKKDAPSGVYYVRNLPRDRLTWPELTRRRVEHDCGPEPTLGQRWITLRYVLRKNAIQVYLDDRLLRDGRDPKLDTTGHFRLRLYNNMQLASLSIRELPPEEERFEMVPLAGYVNSGSFQGQALKREGLSATATVGGVKFALAAPDAKGRDHVDLHPSWLRCGLIEGGHDGLEGDTARWRGTLARDPARMQFRVRNGSYSKLHLLAAFTGEPDTTPVVTAQFYRASAGHPVNFTGRVPLFSAPAQIHALPAQLANGVKGNLHLVTIPLEPNGVAAFSDQDCLEFELTKEVRLHRSFPDPIYYSSHGAGLPSGVHVFAISLERPAVEVDFQPDKLAHIWVAPEQPGYTTKLRNTTPAEQAVEMELTTTSHDGLEKTTVRQSARVAAGTEQAVKLPLKLKKHGYHDVELKVRSAGEVRTQKRSLAYLHPDTRERGNWEEGKGPIFGMWDWNGGHLTLSGMDRLHVMAPLGLESSMATFVNLPKEEQDFLASIGAKSFFVAYQLAMTKDTLGGKEWDPTKPAEMQEALIKWLKSRPDSKPSKINHPELAIFFGEPMLGPVSYMSLPEYYGDPPYQLTAEERAAYKRHLDQFLIAAAAIKKEWPHAKCLMPWGIPSFPIPFLRESKEATALMDGPAIDLILFERMPEMQCHQVTYASTMWQLKQEWLKTGKPWPKLATIEGVCASPARPGAITAQEEADHTVRSVLLLSAFNTTRFLGWPTASHCAGAWGETHYGSGLCEPLPLLSPRPVYSAYAAMTRHLNRMNFVKLLPTPSPTVFCCQFKHYKTGELLHVFWNVRGKRPVTLEVAAGTKVVVYDSMDNPTDLSAKATFTISPAPCYVRGLSADAKFTIGAANHSDAQPGANAVRLAELGDGSWKLSTERDAVYENVHPEFIKKFPGKFTVKLEAEQQGHGKALAIHLEKPEKERRTMPFYTTLTPAKPLLIPGKASHLGLWVKAASDWGRVVYCLRDAKGERWLSVGKKGEWNVDDVHSWSAFNFDGWRYLPFELPSNAPYDLYREAGTSFWGYYGEGDAVVDLPLTLEKIIVERRTHVIHGTEQLPAPADDVLLGGLYAEYETPANKADEVVRLSRLRMPLPSGAPALDNPIAKLAETGTGTAPEITRVTPPEREYDGRRCHVHFAAVPSAKSYEVWVATYADGRGAIPLGEKWTAPGQLLTGLAPNVDFYLFLVVKDAAEKPSKPSKGFKVNLKDMFPMK